MCWEVQPLWALCSSPASGELSYLALAVSQDHAGIQLGVGGGLAAEASTPIGMQEWWLLVAELCVGRAPCWLIPALAEPLCQESLRAILCCLMSLSQLSPPGCTCVVSPLATLAGIPRPPTPQSQSQRSAIPRNLFPFKNTGSAGLAGNPLVLFSLCVSDWAQTPAPSV